MTNCEQNFYSYTPTFVKKIAEEVRELTEKVADIARTNTRIVKINPRAYIRPCEVSGIGKDGDEIFIIRNGCPDFIKTSFTTIEEAATALGLTIS